MFSIRRSVEIAKPIEEVFAFVTDASRLPLWRKEVLASTGPTKVTVGTEFVETIRFMGRKNFTMRVTALEQNKREVIENIAGPGVRPLQTFTFEPTSKGTRFSVSVTVHTFGFFRLMEPMMPRMIERNWDRYLETLKPLLEQA